MSSIFGGSKQKSSSSNQAYGYIKSTYSPLTSYATQGADAISALLGGDASGLQSYKDATGYNFQAEQGSRGITGNQAAAGMLRSGGTGKSLMNFGTNLNNQYAGDYLDRLLSLANLGLGAGSLISNAGNTSESSGKSKNGLGSILGATLAL